MTMNCLILHLLYCLHYSYSFAKASLEKRRTHECAAAVFIWLFGQRLLETHLIYCFHAKEKET